LWGWVNCETELGFLTVIDRKSFKKERSETRSSSSTNSVEYKETLETCALISELSDSIKAEINNFFTNCVVTSSKVVSSIFFTRDKLFWMEELSVCSCSNFIDNSWFKIKEDSSWNMLTGTGFGEEGVEGIISTTDRFIGRHLTIWLDTVLKAEEFPTGITDLNTGLTNMD